MDWKHLSFDWNRVRTFLATAEEGSYSAAARALGMAQPTVGRQVAALEETLGVALFERVGRGLVPTPTGLELLEHAREMAESAMKISRVAAGQSLSLDGSICIAASEAVAGHLLPPIIGRIRSLHPGIEVEIVASIQASDLSKREADIAIRNFQPTTPDLVARKIKDSRAHLYATPGYLEQIGSPQGPEDLSEADFIGFDRGDALLKGLNAMGLNLTASNIPLLTANQLVQWALVKQGAGIGIMLEEIGDLDPDVQRVLPEMTPFVVPMWLTSHREVRTSRRVRVVFDLLVEGLSG